MKRFLSCLMGILLLFCIGGCAPQEKPLEDGRLTIVATLFPQYDFARTIAGKQADVTMLLPVGTEAHGFDPTPSDMLTLNRSDLLFYTGDSMEPWVQELTADIANLSVVDLSETISLLEAHHEEDGHEHGNFDPHIWTDPKIAMEMARKIGAAMMEKDPENRAVYEENLSTLLSELSALDADFSALVDSVEKPTIYFCGRFALSYFCTSYGINHVSPYAGCAESAEPSPVALAEIIDAVNKNNVPVVFYEELTDPKVANFVAEQTGAAPHLLHSCHNVTQEEWDRNVSYISLMRQNYEYLKKGWKK
ncbi:MAG: zinc ABC transporter substrate-binding protein [Clostridia bacterium]|nr:zinc ABC transporter substrate-binding protein [Clostridia bacterium]